MSPYFLPDSAMLGRIFFHILEGLLLHQNKENFQNSIQQIHHLHSNPTFPHSTLQTTTSLLSYLATSYHGPLRNLSQHHILNTSLSLDADPAKPSDRDDNPTISQKLFSASLKILLLPLGQTFHARSIHHHCIIHAPLTTDVGLIKPSACADTLLASHSSTPTLIFSVPL
mmetsp:Transcript_39848/g.77839  ORF Transcript_39848/g.77839 Transcript_39848/m.77839 type:complete len:170 (+) Transcript_39848:493-1002(+)